MLRIVFKTKDELAFKASAGMSPGEFLSRQKIFAGIDGLDSPGSEEIRNLFSTLDTTQLRSLIKRARQYDPGYDVPDFLSYYYLECRKEINLVKTLREIRKDTAVEWAYVEGNSSIAPHSHASAKPLVCYQGYLYDAPSGIGVSHAWKRKGGRGDSAVKFVDVEQGWLFDHESLDLQRMPNTGINHEAFSDHGAAVMGIIMMRDGGSGALGITPLVKGSVMSLYRPNGILNTPDAILSALVYLDAGDILLLETQVPDPKDGYRLWPLESRQANFDMIRLATALGITVIEPAGNGNIHSSCGNDLDKFKNCLGKKIFDRRNRDYRDSGAIMVAAATSDTPHKRMHFSNYGNRIDCYAWGENILTAGLHPRSSGIAINTYTHQFGGTSGAASIIAGVTISLQSLMEANHHCRLRPVQARDILANVSFGTASSGGKDSDRIGVMPDLEKITRDYVDKFESIEAIIPLKQYNIELPSIYDEAV